MGTFTQIYGVGLIITGIFVMVWICSIAARRPEKREELRRYIDHISDQRGSKEALTRFYPECVHIVDYYMVTLESAGFTGTIEDLRILAGQSADRALGKTHGPSIAPQRVVINLV